MTAHLNARLGAIIRQKRVLLGMSQEALGQKLGITFQQIQKYEKGKNQVTFSRLVELAAVLNTTAAELVTAALGKEPVEREDTSDRDMLEMVKRWGKLGKRQRQGVRLLVQNLAEAG